MASLKELRNRIGSVKATQKITKAMQMVAASKLRRAQDAAEAARPYAERMDAVLANLAGSMLTSAGASPLLVGTGKDDTHLLVVATADRGLCGGFNSSISRLAREHVQRLLADGKEVKILCVGRKGRDILKRQFAQLIVDTFEFTDVRRVGFAEAETVSKRILDMFDAGEFDVATLFFSAFQNVVTQVPTAQQIIPASIPERPEGEEDASVPYEYEPEETEIMNDLLPRNLTTQVFRALLENAASEQGARMSAMDSATRNAGDMIDKLTLTYNRTRQAQITKELIEIISGAEAI